MQENKYILTKRLSSIIILLGYICRFKTKKSIYQYNKVYTDMCPQLKYIFSKIITFLLYSFELLFL